MVARNNPYGIQMGKSSKSVLPSSDVAKKSIDSIHFKLRDLTEEAKSQFDKLEDQIIRLTHGNETKQVSWKLENVSVVYIEKVK